MTTSSVPMTSTQVFDVIDSLDAATYAGLFSDCGRLVFANGDPMTGPAEIQAGVEAFFATIKGLHHTIVNTWRIDTTTVNELLVTYDRLDGNSVTVPVVAIWHRDARGAFDDYRIYFDLAPVYA